MRMPREFYISHLQAVLHYAEPAQGVAVYYYERGGKICAIGFSGKAEKPRFQYAFATDAKRNEYVTRWLESLSSRKAEKAAARAVKNEFRHSLKVGDVLYTSWGYEQTNIDFYEVVEAREKSVLIREIGQKREYDERGDTGRCTPAKGVYKGEPVLKRVQEGNRLRIASYAYATPVADRESFYWSSYA